MLTLQVPVLLIQLAACLECPLTVSDRLSGIFKYCLPCMVIIAADNSQFL